MYKSLLIKKLKSLYQICVNNNLLFFYSLQEKNQDKKHKISITILKPNHVCDLNYSGNYKQLYYYVNTIYKVLMIVYQ